MPPTGTGESHQANAPNETKLNLRSLPPKQFAAELEQRVNDVEAAVKSIEAAKVVTQEVLEMEISILPE